MRCALAVAVILFAVPAWAGNGREAVPGLILDLLGELDRQAQRDADRRQAKVRAMIQACFAGDDPACTQALRHPLPDRTRRAVLQRLEDISARREASERAYQSFLQSWNSCRDGGVIAACDAALTYSNLSHADRGRLMDWRYAAAERAQALARKAMEAQRVQERERERVRALAVSPPEPIPAAAAPITTSALQAPTLRRSLLSDMLPIACILISVLAVIACFQTFFSTSKDMADASADSSGNGPPPLSASHLFALTGDFPTDIRRALAS